MRLTVFSTRLIHLGLCLIQFSSANNDDVFSYRMRTRETREGDTNYGQPEWGLVECDNIDKCTGFPNDYPHGFGFSIDEGNFCAWCPEDGDHDACGQHRQSPIDLFRSPSIPGGSDEKECPDWHWMQVKDDSCAWEDMKDHFTIERHALQIHVPQIDTGEIDCFGRVGNNEGKKRRYPRLDYSKGFPDWWWMQRTDVMVPSQHIQEGKRYAAEVTLAHFYEVAHEKNQLGHIAIFLQDYEDAISWAYLDKLICQWRIEEEKVRSDCDKDPAPPYGRCRLFRDQEPTEEWLREAEEPVFTEQAATSTPTVQTTSAPVSDSPVTATPSTMAPSTNAPSTKAPTTLAPVKPAVFTVTPTTSAPHTSSPSAQAGTINTDTPFESPVERESAAPFTLSSTRTEPIEGNNTRAPTVAGTSQSPSFLQSDLPSEAPSILSGRVVPPTFSDMPSSVPLTAVEPDHSGGEVLFNALPAPITCSDYNLNWARVCDSSDPCCGGERADTNFCWDTYDLLGDSMASACYHCCSTPKVIGPPTPEKPGLPKTITCSRVDNPHRLCKPNSCCSSPRSETTFCRFIYDFWGDSIEEICHYCCTTPQEVAPKERRNLRLDSENDHSSFQGNSHALPEGARELYIHGKKYVLGPDDLEDDDEDEQAYFDRIYADHKRRDLQEGGVHAEDYEDIEWFPYEWLLKVGTEYYYRYEGTMLVPPCWDTVHWRPMKDPIRVHKRQIDELNRLLAWRRNPDTCKRDTAGVVSDDGDRIEVNREVQYYHEIHRQVFCECKDWPSKFDGDRQWCQDWQKDTNHTRFYERPYSFDTEGEW